VDVDAAESGRTRQPSRIVTNSESELPALYRTTGGRESFAHATELTEVAAG
jgi:hypothetical protein